MVLFKGAQLAVELEQQLPIVHAPYDVDSGVSVPHGLALDMASSLPGLWYCLHLPNTFFALRSIPAKNLSAERQLQLAHHITLVPEQLFTAEYFNMWHDPAAALPALVVCPDELGDVAMKASDLGFPLPVARYSELSDDSLVRHWRAVHEHFVPDAQYFGREPKLSRRLDWAASDLSRRWLARQMLEDSDEEFLVSGSPDSIQAAAIRGQVMLAAIARLERQGLSMEQGQKLLPEAIRKASASVRFPVALAAPGVAPKYCRDAYSPELRQRIRVLPRTDDRDTWSSEMHHRPDDLIERSAIEFMVAHKSIANGSPGLMLPAIPPKAFVALAALERHFIDGERGPVVWRLLDRLNSACSSVWTADVVATISRASTVTAFTNFPIGLLRLPGDSSPISARVPIAYRPILPLTRALQYELRATPAIHLPKPAKVLIAECIPSEDPVGRVSRAGWQAILELQRQGARPLIVEMAETLSVHALRREIQHRKPNILIISAHGSFNPRASIAQLVVGSELCSGPGLGPLPPVVLLSACHVAPRGASTVTITDLLLREGAIAVLGAQVPVDVQRNMLLMGRFLANISEALAGGGEEYATLLDAWHQTQGGNAVNEILFAGNATLAAWGLSLSSRGIPVVHDFMASRSVGRLRRGHIYADSEAVLGEMADESGVGTKIRNAMKRPGYVPESLLYVMAGWPDRIYMRPLQETVKAELRET